VDESWKGSKLTNSSRISREGARARAYVVGKDSEVGPQVLAEIFDRQFHNSEAMALKKILAILADN